MPNIGWWRIPISCGYLGVDLFFVLSGFLLARPWFSAELTGKPKPSLRTFWSRRLRRIAPAYYASVIVVLTLGLGTPLLPRAAIEGPLGVWNLGSILLLVQNYVPLASNNLGGIGGPWWTLSLELTWYVVLPVVVLGFVRRRWRVTLPVLLAVSVAWIFLSSTWFDPLIHFMQSNISPTTSSTLGVPNDELRMRQLLLKQLPAYLFEFGIGIALARLEVIKRLSPSNSTLWWTWPAVPVAAFCAGVFWLAATQISLFMTWIHPTAGGVQWIRYSHTVFAIGIGLCVFGIAFGPKALRAPFTILPARYIGWVSYGIYLYHVPIWFWTSQHWHRSPDSAAEAYLTVFGAVLGASTVAATISWLLIERPFLAESGVLSRSARAVVVVLAVALVATCLFSGRALLS